MSSGDGSQQESQLVFHVVVTSDGLRDFLVENMTITLTQPVQRDAHGRSAQAEPGRDRRVRCVLAAAGETRAERIEEFRPSGGDMLVAQASRDTTEQRDRPSVIESDVGRQIAGWRIRESALGRLRVERHEQVRAAFFGAIVVAPIGKVVVEAAEQKRAETAALPIHVGE